MWYPEKYDFSLWYSINLPSKYKSLGASYIEFPSAIEVEDIN